MNGQDNQVVWYFPWTWPIWGRQGVDVVQQARDDTKFTTILIVVVIAIIFLSRRR